MRCLPFAFLFLLVTTGCDGRNGVGNYLGGGFYDTTPVLLAIEDVRMSIPNNDIQVYDPEGRTGRFTRTGGVLLFLQWPTLEGRTRANIHDIWSTGGDDSKVASILLQTLGRRHRDPRDAFVSNYEFLSTGDVKFCDHPGCLAPQIRGLLQQVAATGPVTQYVRLNDKRVAFWDGPTADIFTRRNADGELTSFVICDRPHSPAKSGIMSPGCSLHGRWGRLSFTSNFPQRTRLRYVWELEQRIRAKLDHYQNDAALVERHANDQP